MTVNPEVAATQDYKPFLAGVRRQGIADGIQQVGNAGSAGSAALAGVGSGISQGLATVGAGAVGAAGQGAAAGAGCKDDSDWSVSIAIISPLCIMTERPYRCLGLEPVNIYYHRWWHPSNVCHSL